MTKKVTGAKGVHLAEGQTDLDQNYVLSRRERKKLDCKYAILKAAKELMQERGVEVSIDEIANRADISYPTFYNYFPTKSSLYYAIYLEEIEDIREFAQLELQGEMSAVVRIERIFATLMDDFIRYRYLDLFLAGEVARHTAEIDEEEQISLCFMRLIERGQENGEFSMEANARQYAIMIAGLLFSVSFYGCGSDEYMQMLKILIESLKK